MLLWICFPQLRHTNIKNMLPGQQWQNIGCRAPTDTRKTTSQAKKVNIWFSDLTDTRLVSSAPAPLWIIWGIYQMPILMNQKYLKLLKLATTAFWTWASVTSENQLYPSHIVLAVRWLVRPGLQYHSIPIITIFPELEPRTPYSVMCVYSILREMTSVFVKSGTRYTLQCCGSFRAPNHTLT